MNFDGLVIDRILSAVAEDFNGNLLYRLTQLSDASLETSAESKEATDAQGILIKKFYSSKSATFSATNTLLDLNVIGETTGSGKQVASSTSTIKMPRMMIVKPSTDAITLPETPITGTLKISAVSSNGTLGNVYTASASAGACAVARRVGHECFM